MLYGFFMYNVVRFLWFSDEKNMMMMTWWSFSLALND